MTLRRYGTSDVCKRRQDALKKLSHARKSWRPRITQRSCFSILHAFIDISATKLELEDGHCNRSRLAKSIHFLTCAHSRWRCEVGAAAYPGRRRPLKRSAG